MTFSHKAEQQMSATSKSLEMITICNFMRTANTAGRNNTWRNTQETFNKELNFYSKKLEEGLSYYLVAQNDMVIILMIINPIYKTYE